MKTNDGRFKKVVEAEAFEDTKDNWKLDKR